MRTVAIKYNFSEVLSATFSDVLFRFVLFCFYQRRGLHVQFVWTFLRVCQVFVDASDRRLSRQVALNVTTEKYFLRPVLSEVTYRVQLLAYNDVDDGPRSDVITVGQWLRTHPLDYYFRKLQFSDSGDYMCSKYGFCF